MGKSHIHVLKSFLSVLTFLCLSLQIYAQDMAQGIPQKQEQNARSQARFLIESFGEFLQIISQSEDGGEVRAMIRMVTEDGQLSKRLFSDKDVLIVSDIDPRVVDEESTVGEGFVEVGTYLADFDAFYAKNLPNDILFSEILVSGLKKSRLTGELYLKVKFKSRFSGRHKDIRKAYEETHRLARVKVIPGDQWAYYIDQVRFFAEDDTSHYFEVETRAQIKRRYQSQLRRAQRLWEIYEYEAALENYRLSNQIFPSDSISQKIDFIEEAIDDQKDRSYYALDGYNRKIADEINNPDLYYERGLKYLGIRKVKAASDDFLKALELSNDKYKKAWIALADLWEGEQGINGIEYLEKALSLDPEDVSTLNRLIGLQIRARLWTDCKRNLLKVENIQENKEMLLNLGIVNQNLDQHRDATHSFHQILELEPDFGRAHFELGRSYLNLSEFSLSMEHFQEAIRLEENTYSRSYVADIYLHKAEQYQQQDKNILATKAVDQALILLPDMPEAKSLRRSLSGIQEEIQPVQSEERRTGDLYYMEGNYKEALKYYKTLKKRTSLADRDLSLKIGKCYLQLADYNRAILSAQEVLFLNSTDPDAMLLKAEALSAQGEKIPALIMIKDIMRAHPEFLEAIALKTRIHIEEKDYVAAGLSIARWEGLESQMGITQNPSRQKLLAKALLGQKKAEEALTEIDAILQLENFNTEFLYLKAKALYDLRNFEESLTFSEAALESQKNYEPALLLKIKAYLKKGSPQLALSSIDELQGLNNKDLFTLAYYKAMANYKLKEFKTAKGWIERALRARRNDFQAVLLHGKILLALEKFLDAGMTLNTAYKLKPDHPEANFELGRYYHLFGARQSEEKRFEDALPYYHKAMELAPELFEEYPDLLDKLKE